MSSLFSKNNEVAFVTAYLDIYHDDTVELSRNRGVEWRLKTFEPLADTGIPLFLFYSQKYAPHFENQEYQTRHPNVILFRVIELEQTWTWKIAAQHSPLQLPEERDTKKDTYQYMVLQNAKQELIHQVMEHHPHYQHYAWIDFSIVHMFKTPQKSLEYLRVCYGPRSTPRTPPVQDAPQFFMPGCWTQQWFEPDLDAILKRIHWRFCGSFFIASAKSMRNFIRVYRHCFKQFLKEHRRMIWEVNFWAWMEVTNEIILKMNPLPLDTDSSSPLLPIEPWKPSWYSSDHNDSIYRAPYYHFISQPLNMYLDTHVQLLLLPSEKQPQPEQEWIGSSSFTHSTKHGPLLNTRVMNYWLYPNGYYRFTDPKQIIRSRSLLSRLDEQGQPIDSYEVTEDLGLSILQYHKPDAFSQGLEDIRLWISPKDDKTQLPESIRFIATNVNYSPSARGRMITGTLEMNYQEETEQWKPVFKHAVGLEPPTDTYAEKNWIPLVLKNDKNEATEYSEHFIYQWSPYQLGKIDYPTVIDSDETKIPRPQLQIHTIVSSQNSFLFERVRGSSPFVPFPTYDSLPFRKEKREEWLGVVHFSDEASPRKYSHILISLDTHGIPVRYSAPFSFCTIGVEFCIGFHVLEKEQTTLLRFWISRHDRDTSILTTPLYHIPLDYEFCKEAIGYFEKEEEKKGEVQSFLPSDLLIPQELTNMPTTPIHLFILCYNEELLLPHTLRHYRTYLPHAYITVYDNQSTDRSREIAEAWGCRVVIWNSGNEQNEYIQQNLKNDVWKTASPFHEVQIDPRPECSGKGWKLVVDMDEWVVVTESQLAEEEAIGTSVLRIKGVNVIGESQDEMLRDVTSENIHQWKCVTDWIPENKNLCFLSPPITRMNYTPGAHACRPEGERVVYSKKIYYNKHMENLGLPFLIRKFTLRKQRNHSMHIHQLNLHYTDDLKQLEERFRGIVDKSYVLPDFSPIDNEGMVLNTDYYYV